MQTKIEITIDDGRYPFETPVDEDNGWVDGIDRCANCPNRPGGPNNKEGVCFCAIPSMFGPNRITC